MSRDTMEEMKAVTLQQLPIPQEDRHTLDGIAGVHGALYAEGKAVVFGPACGFKTEAQALAAYPQSTLVWRRVLSRVAAALALMETEKITAHAAAQRVGVEVSAVYRAQRLREERGVCECCGQLLPEVKP